MLTKKIFSTIVAIIFLILNFGYAQPDSLRVPIGTQEAKKRQQDAQRQLFLEKYGKDGTKVVALASPIDARLESSESAVTGITCMVNGQILTRIFDPAPVLDFNLVRKIRDRYDGDKNGDTVTKEEGDLYEQVMWVKEFLGLYGKGLSVLELIDILTNTKDPMGTAALVALELKGAMFRASRQSPMNDINVTLRKIRAASFSDSLFSDKWSNWGKLISPLLKALRDNKQHIERGQIEQALAMYSDIFEEGGRYPDWMRYDDVQKRAAEISVFLQELFSLRNDLMTIEDVFYVLNVFKTLKALWDKNDSERHKYGASYSKTWDLFYRQSLSRVYNKVCDIVLAGIFSSPDTFFGNKDNFVKLLGYIDSTKDPILKKFFMDRIDAALSATKKPFWEKTPKTTDDAIVISRIVALSYKLSSALNALKNSSLQQYPEEILDNLSTSYNKSLVPEEVSLAANAIKAKDRKTVIAWSRKHNGQENCQGLIDALAKGDEEFAIASLCDLRLAQLISKQRLAKDSSTLSNLRKYLQENPDAFGRESMESILVTFAAWCANTSYYYSRQGESRDFFAYLRDLNEFTAELLSRKESLIREEDLRNVLDTILGARPKELVVHISIASRYYASLQGDGILPSEIDQYTPWLGFLKQRYFLVRIFAQTMAQHPNAIIGTKEKLKDLIIFLNEKTLPEERVILIRALYPIFEASFDSRYASIWDEETVSLIIEEKEDNRLEIKAGWEPVFDLIKQKQSLFIAETLPEDANIGIFEATYAFSRKALIDAVKKGYIRYDFESKVWANNVNECLPMDILRGVAGFADDLEKKIKAEGLIADLRSNLCPETIKSVEAFIEGLSKEDLHYYRYYENKMDYAGRRLSDIAARGGMIIEWWRSDEKLYWYTRELETRLGPEERDSLAIIEARRLYDWLINHDKLRGPENNLLKAYNINVKDRLYSPKIVAGVLYTLQNTIQNRLRALWSGL